MMPTFSLAALTVLDLAPPALIDVAAACGYDHVGLRLLPAMAGGIAYPLMDDKAALKETLARLDATGITVADLEVVAFRPETEIAAFAAFFETGARLGAKHILVAGYDPDLDRFTDRYAAVLRGGRPPRPDGRSRIHALDLCPGSCDRQPDCRAGRAGQCRHPGGCAALRPVEQFDRRTRPRSRRTGCTIGSYATARPSGRRRRKQLIHAARYERMFPGEGGIDLVSLTRAMPADITVSIEVPTAELAKTVDAKTRAQRALDAARRRDRRGPGLALTNGLGADKVICAGRT